MLTLEPSPWNLFLLKLNLLQNIPEETYRASLVALQGGLSELPGEFHGSHLFGNAWASKNNDIFQPDRAIKGSLSVSVGDVGDFTAPLRTLPTLMKDYSISHVVVMKLD